MTPRSELRLAVFLTLLGGLACLWGASSDWVSVQSTDTLALGTGPASATGRQLWPSLSAVAWSSLAAVLVIVALRGWARRTVGVILAGCGVIVVADSVSALHEMPLPARLCVGVCEGLRSEVHTHHPAVLLTLAGGVTLLATGLFTLWRGGPWEGLGASYEAPGSDPQPPVTDKGVWDALDRGDDPTA